MVFANLLAINDFVCITRLSQFHLLISLFVFNSLSIVNSSAPGTKSNLRLIPVRIVYEFRSIVCVCLIWLCFVFFFNAIVNYFK